MDFKQDWQHKIEWIESGLAELLKPRQPEIIYEAMRYSVMAGGKRLRPVLLLTAFGMCGGPPQATDALAFACALEMIHTYSLIHDDLPAMDNDDLRRGKPTCHKAFGEANAILAGDGLLNLAFETMIKQCLTYPHSSALAAMAAIAEAAGVEGMIGGQVVDMAFENKKADERTLLYIHDHKTGKLFHAALSAGALLALGNGNPEQTDAFGTLGQKLGRVFQIQDDILDVCGSTERLGKAVQGDAARQKSTWVSLHGLPKARQDCQTLWDEILRLTAELPGDGRFLAALLQSLVNRDY